MTNKVIVIISEAIAIHWMLISAIEELGEERV